MTDANDEGLIHAQFEGGSGHATNSLSAVRTMPGCRLDAALAKRPTK
jgi:hypothetical protein